MSISETVHFALSILILLALVGVVVYGIVLLIALFGAEEGFGGKLRTFIHKSPDLSVGIPCAGIASVALVATMLKAFMQNGGEGGNLQIVAFDMQFSGPSGPVTLWVVCFLAIVGAIRMLRR